MEPPRLLAAVLSPAFTKTSPPGPVSPLPTLATMLPALPDVAAPDAIVTEPDVPELVVPDLNVNEPLTPASPAFRLSRTSAPDDVLDPYPVATLTLPPVRGVLEPAENMMCPPSDTLPVPRDTVKSPDLPPVADPVATDIAQDAPLLVVPV